MVKKVHNWGIYPVIDADVITVKYPELLPEIMEGRETLIAQGNGRCYGDSSLNTTMLSTLAMNKIVAFDRASGVITCQSGVLLSDILKVIVPCGYFLPVTPGTKFITVGGAIAADIHGKNHHTDGCFSSHIVTMDVMMHSGDIVSCNAHTNSDIFRNTCGGMGLTGIILQATFTLKKIETSYITQKALKAKNLDIIMDYFSANEQYTYSVAWIDCLAKGKDLGKSILMLGEHSTMAELNSDKQKNPLNVNDNTRISIPFYFPSFTLNKWTINAFNFLYYHKQFAEEQVSQIHYEPFFYPLDAVLHWNKIYGKSGFTQYQFVLPMEGSRQGLKDILTAIADSGEGSFLAVLKLFGEADNEAVMSFPSRGYTLALDFKISPKVFRLLDKLDDIVLHHGGRLYLAKDVRMSKDFFHKTYQKIVQRQRGFSSLQSDRLGI